MIPLNHSIMKNSTMYEQMVRKSIKIVMELTHILFQKEKFYFTYFFYEVIKLVNFQKLLTSKSKFIKKTYRLNS
jgi:hypothetical protein